MCTGHVKACMRMVHAKYHQYRCRTNQMNFDCPILCAYQYSIPTKPLTWSCLHRTSWNHSWFLSSASRPHMYTVYTFCQKRVPILGSACGPLHPWPDLQDIATPTCWWSYLGSVHGRGLKRILGGGEWWVWVRDDLGTASCPLNQQDSMTSKWIIEGTAKTYPDHSRSLVETFLTLAHAKPPNKTWKTPQWHTQVHTLFPNTRVFWKNRTVYIYIYIQ